jgi:hypothetical protein
VVKLSLLVFWVCPPFSGLKIHVLNPEEKHRHYRVLRKKCKELQTTDARGMKKTHEHKTNFEGNRRRLQDNIK